ncbi:MAG: hypothetical protein AAFV07_07875 [Bacteroidota bacterium]
MEPCIRLPTAASGRDGWRGDRGLEGATNGSGPEGTERQRTLQAPDPDHEARPGSGDRPHETERPLCFEKRDRPEGLRDIFQAGVDFGRGMASA